MDKSSIVFANREGGKENFRSQNYCFFKVFEMGCQPSACKKKEQWNNIVLDFWNLNKVSLKHYYPLPKMDYILQKVVGSQKMSILGSE